MKKLLLFCLLVCLTKLNAQICFKAPILFTPGQTPKMVRSADLDRNGIADFITINDTGSNTGRITVFMNFSSTTYSFATQSTSNLGVTAQFTDLGIADFDGDSIKDIVALTFSNPGQVIFFPGNGASGIGNGTFGLATSFTVGAYPGSISIADYNNDNKPDLTVYTGSPSGFAVLTNTSTVGSFGFSTSNVSMTSPQALASADFNRDNKVDIAVVSYSYNNVSIFFNDGTGTFTSTPSYTYAAGSSPNYFTVGDFDGINGVDIATANNSSSYLNVILNNGAGGFGAVNTYNAGTTSLEGINCGDFDLDGKVDIAGIGYGTSSGLFIFNGTGTGTFNTASQIVNTSTSSNIPLIEGDYNADGTLDLAYLYSNTVNILINAKPVISGVTSICIGATATLTATGATNYTWSTGNTNATVILSPTIATTYTVTGTTGTCSSASTSTVTVNALPTIVANPSSSSICIGSQTTLSVTGAATYFWNPGTYTGATYSVSPGSTTVYTVIGTDANGCVNSANVTVVANPKPPAFSSVNTPVCEGQPLTFTTSTGGAAYAWIEADGSTSTLQNPNIAAAALTNSGVYSFTVTSAQGCTNTATVSATVNPLPTIIITSAAICQGASTVLTATGGVTANNYTWLPGGIVTTALTTTATSTTIYTVTGTSTAGCIGTGTGTLTVNTLPVFAVNSPTICYGSTANLTTTVTVGTPPYTYTWSNGATTSNTSVNPLLFTQYNLSLTDANGCVGTGTTVANVTVLSNDDLSGTIYDTTSVSGLHPITQGGLVYLYTQQNSSTAIDTTGLLANGISTLIQPNGSYTFHQVLGGTYYIKAEADTHFYHGSVATYLSTQQNTYRWNFATVVTHIGCGVGTDAGHDINIIELPALTGTGVISGTITAAPTFGQRYASGGHNQTFGSPLKGVDVKLGKSPGGGCSARTRADTSGAYTFTGVDTGRYSIYVDIPNYGMVTILTTTISPTNMQSTNNNYCVDSVAINVCTSSVGIKQNVNNSYNVSIYPNPNSGIFNLQVADHENMSVEVYNVIGQKVYAETLQNNTQSLNISTLNDGVYFVRVLKNNSVVYQTKICKQ